MCRRASPAFEIVCMNILCFKRLRAEEVVSVIFHFNWLNEELVIFFRNWSCLESGLVNKPVYLVVFYKKSRCR